MDCIFVLVVQCNAIQSTAAMCQNLFRVGYFSTALELYLRGG
jgi:hypothetical protein